MYVPWLPPGYTAVLPGRGEMFYRHHQHPDPAAPTVVLLHGWTASADLQFFTAYEELAQHVSFIAPDHRGHGRGMRPAEKFRLEDVADDVAALAAALGITKLIAVGYSMGGPIALLLNRAHPDLVAGLVLEATALEWRATRAERLRWKTVGLMSPMMRSWTSPHVMRWALRRVVRRHPALADHVEWVAGEASRNNAVGVVQAGRALSGYDARTWAEALATPSEMLVTTRDRLVLPRKQRQLAAALGAHVAELDGDHLASWMNSVQFSALTTELVRRVAADISPTRDSTTEPGIAARPVESVEAG